MNEVTWYEDGNFLEWFESKTERHYIEDVGLEQAIQFAWENKTLLYIQTAYQDAGLFIDYTKKEKKTMKNRDLIKKLLDFNLDADVSLTTSSDICLSYISRGGANQQTTKQIFIEPADLCESCGWHDGGGYCTAYNSKCEDVGECYQYEEE